MPISSQTVPNWSALERKILEGGYELEQCLNPTEVAARFKVRILGDRFTEAIADVFAPGTVPRGQIALWAEAAALDHPNINRPMSAGEVTADGGMWPYFVRLRPDETLGTVLAERALTVDETREVTRSITAALEYLHGNGYVHGGISPENVLAIGDSIQLSTLHLHRANVSIGPARAGARFRAPESPLENSTPAADIYCLGCALFEVLTGKKVTADSPADPVELPQPFAYIVDRCLEPDPEKRLSLSSIQALLEGRQIAQPAEDPEPAIHELAMEPITDRVNEPPAREEHSISGARLGPEAKPPATPEPLIARESAPFVPVSAESVAGRSEARTTSATPPHSARPLRQPSPEAAAAAFSAEERIRARREAAEKTYVRPTPLEKQERETESSGSKPWMWVILAAVLLGGILWLARPKSTAKPQPTVTPKTDVAAGVAAPVGGASHIVGPDGSTPAHATAAAAASSAIASEKSRPHGNLTEERVWRVVAWTYLHESDAQRRVASVKEKHADLNPEVFSPHGHVSPYLVTVGGQMTRPEAERLRQKARAAGLPRDSYVQNYTH